MVVATAIRVAIRNLAAARTTVVGKYDPMNSVMVGSMESTAPVAASATLVPAFPIVRAHGALSHLGVRMVQAP